MQHASKYQISEDWLILEHFWEQFQLQLCEKFLGPWVQAIIRPARASVDGSGWCFPVPFVWGSRLRLVTSKCGEEAGQMNQLDMFFLVLCELPFDKGLEWLVCKTSSLCNSIWLSAVLFSSHVHRICFSLIYAAGGQQCQRGGFFEFIKYFLNIRKTLNWTHSKSCMASTLWHSQGAGK